MPSIAAFTLACGTPLLVEKISGVNSVALTWLTRFGHAHDPENRLGRAAVTAEMLMRGDSERDARAQADAFDRIGSSRSIDAGKRFMRLSTTVLREHLDAAAGLFADNILRPRFDEASLEPSRDLALQALAGLEDDPQHVAVLAARERHHPAPLNRSGYGDEAGLNALTREEIASAWAAAARPEGTILSVAGAVEPERVHELFDGLLAGWSGAAPEFELGATPPRGYAHKDDADANQVQIVLVHDAPPEPDPNAVKERLLTSVLSGGMSGRLFTEVREKRGLCYSVSASFGAERDRGTVTAYVGTTPERAQESLDVLTQELIRITTPGGAITREEFDRAVVGMKSRLVFSGESSAARSSALASDWHRLGRTRSLEELAEDIDRVSLDELNDYARSRRLGRVTVQTLGPKALTVPAELG
jgi:predicted Zn-dependent peptidase